MLGERSVPIGHLRAFVTVLVVAHHSVLAYHPAAPKALQAWTSEVSLWAAFPISDAKRLDAIGLLTGYNDMFFMSLMFFISGLFVWQSLASKGSLTFLRDRIVRLGIPFVVSTAVLAPLAYYPSYLQRGGEPAPEPYVRAWTQLEHWPSGPAWFLWVLLALGTLAALIHWLVPKWGVWLSASAQGDEDWSARFLLRLIVVSAICYCGMLLQLGSDRWLAYGPFTIQGGRVFHYSLYFFAGAVAGAQGLDRGALDPRGWVSRHWPLLQIISVVSFAAVIAVIVFAIQASNRPAEMWAIMGGTAFAICCATASFSLVGFFVRWATRSSAVFNSLMANAYGIYLLHYVFASWFQFSLLDSPLSAGAKAATVFAGTLILSWAASSLLRSFQLIRRIV